MLIFFNWVYKHLVLGTLFDYYWITTETNLLIIRRELHRLAGELRVKMLKVHLSLDVRFIGRCDLFVEQQVPVDAAEERVWLDVREAGLGVTAQPLYRVLQHTKYTRNYNSVKSSGTSVLQIIHSCTAHHLPVMTTTPMQFI